MEYDTFTQADQYRLLHAKLRSFEAQHYEASVNLEIAKAAMTGTAATSFEKTAAEAAAAIGVVREALARLPVPEPLPREEKLGPARAREQREARLEARGPKKPA
jgi:hypothetical protein